MIESRFSKVLIQLHNTLGMAKIRWVVTGSVGLALQGVDVEVHDIDIRTDKAGAHDIEGNLSQYVIRKVEFSSTERIRSHFGELSIDGVKVEIMGDTQQCLADGTWEDVIDISSKMCFINYDGLSMPVFSLEYECEAYEKLGRMEKAEQIKKYLLGDRAVKT